MLPIFYNLGNALSSRGRFDEAITAYLKAVDIKRDFAGTIYDIVGLAEHSEETFESALFYNLGNALSSRGRFNEAAAAYQQTLAIKPDHAEAHANLGYVLAKQGRLEEALVHVRKALEIKPEFVAAHHSLDGALALKKEMLKAVARRCELLRSRPNDTALLNDTAWLLATNPNSFVRNGTKAVELAQRAVELSGGREPAMLSTLAATYAEVGRFAEAVQIARKALDLARQQNNQALVDSIPPKIRLYEAGKPFYELPQPSAAKTAIRP